MNLDTLTTGISTMLQKLSELFSAQTRPSRLPARGDA